jgi:hypothetical protein
MAVLGLLAGCGLKLGESAPSQNPIRFSGKGYSCIGQIPLHIEKFAADQLNEQQVSEFMQCLQKAFTTFGDLTRGADTERYTPDEIRRFLQTYFFKERPITQQLAHEFMVLKQVLIGGSTEFITRKELEDFVVLIEDLRKEAVRLRPHVRYLNPRLIDEQMQQSNARLRTEFKEDLGRHLAEANDALKVSIRMISDRLRRGGHEYGFNNMETLIAEFRRFVRWDETFVDAHPEKNWSTFLKTFKRTTVSPIENEVILTNEWSPMLMGLSRWYLAYIQYTAGIKDQQLFHGSGLQNTMHLAEEIFTLAEDALKVQKNQTLTIKQFKSMVSAVQGLRWVSVKIRDESVERLMHALLDRVFIKEGHPRPDGINKDNLALMKSEFYRWAYVQMRLANDFNMELAKQNAQPKAPSLQSSFFVPLDVKARLVTLKEADWEHFLKIKQLARPLFNDNLERVTLVPGEDLGRFRLAHEFNNLSMMNLFRSLVGAMFRGYSAESNRRLDWAAGLKSEELQNFYVDIRDIAVDLTLADDRVKNTGARAFIEGNLFTYAADGVSFDLTKSRLSFVESMELLAFLYSGSKTSTDFYKQLRALCPNFGPLDRNGDPRLERACVSKQMGELILKYGINMPGMNDYMKQAPVRERDILVQNVMDSAFSPRNCPDQKNIPACKHWVEYSEISVTAVVLHYLEAVLTRFDSNRDGMLNSGEVNLAMPIFRGYIQRFAKDVLGENLSDVDADRVFTYILVYKQIPTSSWYDKFWVWWNGTNKSLNLNRAELSGVFRVIVGKIFATAPAPPADGLRTLSADRAACQVVPTSSKDPLLTPECAL